jgi:protein associated with RNAse G/E
LEEFNNKNDLDYVNNFNTIISKNKEKLNQFIKNKNIQLYYSEINNDLRILKENKEQFSI